MGVVRTIVVEDSLLTREAVVSRLAQLPQIQVVATLENAANAVVACARRSIGLVLMDVCTSDDESGLTAAARIKRESPSTKIVIMTSMPEHTFLVKAQAAGCDSFWYKDLQAVGLLDVVSRTLQGERVWPRETPPVMLGLARSTELTTREFDVLHQLARGLSYEQIASELGISLNTVKYHVRNLLAKTGFESTLALVVEAVDKRLVLPKY